MVSPALLARSFHPQARGDRPDDCDQRLAMFLSASLAPHGRRGLRKVNIARREIAPVRGIIFLVAALIVLGWIAYQTDFSTSAGDAHVGDTWRQTTKGWERLYELSGLKSPPSAVVELWQTHPNPVLVAMFVALFATLVLVAFCPSQRRAQPKKKLTMPESVGEIELRSRAWLTEVE